MSNKLRYSLTGVLILGTIGTIGYKNNWLAVHDSVARYQSEHTPVVSNNHLSISKRESIVERLMKQTHANEGLTKQGFVSMPTVGILQPIFDNSYTNVGLTRVRIIRTVQKLTQMVKISSKWESVIMG